MAPRPLPRIWILVSRRGDRVLLGTFCRLRTARLPAPPELEPGTPIEELEGEARPANIDSAKLERESLEFLSLLNIVLHSLATGRDPLQIAANLGLDPGHGERARRLLLRARRRRKTAPEEGRK